MNKTSANALAAIAVVAASLLFAGNAMARLGDDGDRRPLAMTIAPHDAGTPATLEKPGDSSSGFGLQQVLALAVGVGLVIGLRWAYRKGLLRKLPFKSRGPVELLHRQSVGHRSHVLLLRVGGRIIVAGQTPDHINTLAQFTNPEEIATVRSELQGQGRTQSVAEFAACLTRESSQPAAPPTRAEAQQDVDEDARARARALLRRKYGSTFTALALMLCFIPAAFAQQANLSGSSLDISTSVKPVEMNVADAASASIATPTPGSLVSNVMKSAGEQGELGGMSSSLSVVLLLTAITLVPSIIILCTSFTRIVVVLSLLRQAMGTQSLPPSQIIIGLALFLSLMIMWPTIQTINNNAIEPLSKGEITQEQAWNEARKPLRAFMFAQIDRMENWDTVYMMMNYQRAEPVDPETITYDDVDTMVLVPAFVLSELKTAFLMGFRLYLPFLIIDMVVASILISMGMLMLPPVLISLPFKLLLFVMVDGWMLVSGSLLHSFAIPGVTG